MPISALIRGMMLVVSTLLVILGAISGVGSLKIAAGALGAVYVLLVFPKVRWSRRAFVVVAAGLSAAALLWRADGRQLIEQALISAGFILAFFVALSTLRTAAGSSASIRQCGLFLATRTPAKRYLALAMGGHLFSLVLNYGSISLLGTIVEQAETGPDGKFLNVVRLRRMLLAIQRGFATTLCWSPLSFSMAVGSTLVPGGSWGATAGYGMVTAFLATLLGWGLDVAFKPPRPANAPPPPEPVGSLRSLRPLVLLLAAIVLGTVVFCTLTGLAVIVAVTAVVPTVSVAWIAAQVAAPEPGLPRRSSSAVAAEVGRRCGDFLAREVDSYRGEMVLLYMAGFIGKLGAGLAEPLVGAHLVDLSGMPVWAVLATLVCGMPLLGQAGMHPILAASLMVPLLPSPEALGVSPALVMLAMAFGWSISAVSSPFTATVLLIGVFGRVSALTVGLRWNGIYIVAACAFGVAWLLLLAAMMG